MRRPVRPGGGRLGAGRDALAGGDAAHRVDQLFGRAALRDEAGRAGAEALADHRRRVVHREHQHAQRRQADRQAAQQIEPAAARHRQVEDQQVDRARPRLRQRVIGLVGIGKLGHHFDVGLQLEQPPIAHAHHRMVVGQRPAHRASTRGRSSSILDPDGAHRRPSTFRGGAQVATLQLSCVDNVESAASRASRGAFQFAAERPGALAHAAESAALLHRRGEIDDADAVVVHRPLERGLASCLHDDSRSSTRRACA